MKDLDEKVFFDSDVFLDFFQDRKPFSNAAEQLFSALYQRKIKVVTSSIVISNIYYIASKNANHSKAILLIQSLIEFIDIIPSSRAAIKKALKSNNKDFEDSIQMFSCEEQGDIDFIVTRNLKDYKSSPVNAILPTDYLRMIA